MPQTGHGSFMANEPLKTFPWKQRGQRRRRIAHNRARKAATMPRERAEDAWVRWIMPPSFLRTGPMPFYATPCMDMRSWALIAGVVEPEVFCPLPGSRLGKAEEDK